MTDAGGVSSTMVRRARQDDVDRILDLLTEYDLPRSYFKPFYLDDPTYRPEQSWIVEQNGDLAAHLRLFDRWIRMHDTSMHVAGVGNVITARAFRGQGHAGRLLRAMTSAAAAEDYAYSTLWTHLPTLYERYGWAIIEQQTVRARASDAGSGPTSIRPFRDDDLPLVKHLYETTNGHRTGPTVRTADYWRSQFAWLANDGGEFLVAPRDDESLAGYIRSALTHSEVRILELGVATDELDVGRALIARAGQARDHHVELRLPPSLFGLLTASERDLDDDSRFMGRVLNLHALVRTLEPVLVRRAAVAGLVSGTISVSTSAGWADVRLNDGHLTLEQGSSVDRQACLNEAELAHLLFHGFDQLAAELLDGRPDVGVLRTLFPAQDFVVWPADAF